MTVVTHLLRRLDILFSVCRPSVCLSSVTFVHPTQQVEILGNISTPFGTLTRKFYGDRPRGTSPAAELNARGVSKYSDFGPIEGYAQKRCTGGKLVLITKSQIPLRYLVRTSFEPAPNQLA